MNDLITNENEYLHYQSEKKKEYEDYKNDKFAETRMINEHEVFFADAENINEYNETDFFKSIDTDKLNMFNQRSETEEQKNQRSYNLLHMRSARSSMKSKENSYKKSLTWDSKIQRSIMYFKEDCPFELMKNK